MSGAIAVCIAFLTVYPYFHRAGAGLTIIATGLLVAPPVVGHFWREYRWRSSRALVLSSGLVVLDEGVSHAFGRWTSIAGCL